MKAIIYHAPKVFHYTDVADPPIGPDEVLIKVRVCGICGTDLHIHEGAFLAQFPLIPGHEFAGEIVAVGTAVKDVQEGDRVAVDNMEMCGYCFYCRRNQPVYCEHLQAHGVTAPGGLAEYVAVKAAHVFPIHALSWREAAMVEPTACAIHGMDTIALKPGSDVLLIGAEPTAIVLAQLLKLNGAAHLTIAAPAGRKLDLISRLAADEIVPIDRNDPRRHRERLLTAYPNGFDCVVEATGASHLCQEALLYARFGGQVIVYGVYDEQAHIDWSPYDIFRRGLTIKGSFSQSHDVARALSYLEGGKLKIDEVVTEVFDLANYGQALETARARQGIKCAILL